jgi:phosphatidylglycerophosphatase A
LQLLELERKLVLFVVCGAGIGYIPWFPGTAGTLLAILPSMGLNLIAAQSRSIALLALVAAIGCAIGLSTRGAAMLRQKDPGIIVIDEIVGFLVANFLAPPGLPVLLSAFVLFRFFDITKMFPIAKLEKLAGGAGIVLDDVMAGVYTFVVLRLLIAWGIL